MTCAYDFSGYSRKTFYPLGDRQFMAVARAQKVWDTLGHGFSALHYEMQVVVAQVSIYMRNEVDEGLEVYFIRI